MKKMFRIISILTIAILFLVACDKGKSTSGNVSQIITGDSNAIESTQETTKSEQTTEEVITGEQTTEEAEEETTDTSASEKYSPVTMAFVGDMYLSDRLYGYYTESGLTGFLGPSILDIFQKTDIMIANHEYCASDVGEEMKDTKQLFNFKAPTAREFLWKEMGVDVVSLANNHTMDYGEQSLLDTLDTLDGLGIANIGAGRNLSEALEPEIRVVNGKKIAILAASRFIVDYSWYATNSKPGLMTTYESTDRYDMMKQEITRLKEEEKCDIVCVYVHFGKEKTYTLTSNQPVIAHGYIDAGADLVIGSHAHNLQGIEIYKGAPIYYNLGNFLFNSYIVDTMVVNIEINEDNSISSRVTPCVAKQYYVEEVTDDKAQEIYDLLESISINIDIDENGNVTEKNN